MWFDVQQALTEIEGGTPPPLVQSLAPDPAQRPRVASVAAVATPPASKPAPDAVDQHPHGTAFDGRPLTWTGRVVSLAAWRILTEWERHGPDGRHWNGITKQWEQPKGKCNE